MKKRVLFYSSVKEKDSFRFVQFYNIDISILEKCGCKVVLSNKVRDALKFWKYDFVFAYFYRYSFFVALIAFLFGRKSFFTGGIDSLSQSNKGTKDYKIQSILFKLCYAVCCRAIIVSRTDLENVKMILNNTKKIAYSEHTIAVEKYNADLNRKKDLFVTIGWTSLTSITRKGIDKSIKVFALLQRRPEFSQSMFVIAGTPGDGVNYLYQLIEEYGLDGRVIIKGNVTEEEKIRLLEEAKYYFQLSSYEGFGLAALEAVCAKDILIHSGKGGLSNSIYNNELLFDIDGDFETEVNSLYYNLINYETSQIENSYQKVCDNYSNKRREYELNRILDCL